jgi:hypothetical protein
MQIYFERIFKTILVDDFSCIVLPLNRNKCGHRNHTLEKHWLFEFIKMNECIDALECFKLIPMSFLLFEKYIKRS